MNKKFKAQSDFESYLPHNFLAEKTILSCMIINSQVIEIISKNITVETFYFKNHQELFKAILTMYKDKKGIDIITLTTFLQENGLINKIGGIKVLIELNSQIPNLIHLNELLHKMQLKVQDIKSAASMLSNRDSIGMLRFQTCSGRELPALPHFFFDKRDPL